MTFITDHDLLQLERMAVEADLPLSAAVYRILHRSLRRKRIDPGFPNR